MKTVVARAPGKIILFGEHAVVYGILGVACTVDLYSTVTVSEADTSGKIKMHNYGEDVETDAGSCKLMYENVSGFATADKYEDVLKMLKVDKHNFMKFVIGSVGALGIDVRDVHIKIESELHKGMGCSSSVASAAILALSEYCGKTLTLNKINDLTYQADVFAHGGRPSGIDNNTIVRGGYVAYRKGQGTTTLKTETQLNVVIGDTHVDSSTGMMVERLRKLQEHSEKVKKAIYDIENISDAAVDAIRKNDLSRIGVLMGENQQLLEIMKISHPKLNKLISAAKRAGALGAKLSGGGGGGIMYALTTTETQKAIADAITAAGGEAIITKLGVDGVKIIQS